MIEAKRTDKPAETAPKYPCLLILEDGDLIVAFQSHNTGTVISDDSGNFHVGYHSNGWCEDLYTPYTGVIELSNE